MNKLLFATVALAALPVSANAAVITFDSLPGNTSTYTEQGVTFSAGGQTLLRLAAPGGSPSLLVDGSPRNPTMAVIAGGTGFVSVDLGDFNADQDDLFLRVYDAADVLLGEALLTIPADFTGMKTLSVSANGIAYAVMGGVGVNGSSVFIDNFTWRAGGGVPEPAAWAMMLAGFGLVGSAMRRRESRVLA